MIHDAHVTPEADSQGVVLDGDAIEAGRAVESVHGSEGATGDDASQTVKNKGDTGQTLDPEEGWRAWVVVVGSFLAHVVCLGAMYSVGIYVVPYEEEFGVSQAEGALPYTISAVFTFGGGVFAGRAADMFGVRVVSFVGLIFWATGYVLASFATQFWHAVVAQGAVAGIGTACLYWPAVSVVPQWFTKRRALALGLSVVGAGIGTFVVGVGTQALIDSADFRVALQVTAGVGSVLEMIAIACLKRRLPLEKEGGITGDKGVLKDCKFILFLLGGLIFQFGYHSPFVFLARFAQDAGIDSGFASLCVGMLGIGSACGRVLLGLAADKLGRLEVFQSNIALTAVTLWCWALSYTREGLAAFAFFYGFFSGGFIALIPVVIAELYGTKRLGGIAGIMSTSFVPGVIAGPPLFGALYDLTQDYLAGILLCGSFVAIAAAFILCMIHVKLPEDQVDPEEP